MMDMTYQFREMSSAYLKSITNGDLTVNSIAKEGAGVITRDKFEVFLDTFPEITSYSFTPFYLSDVIKSNGLNHSFTLENSFKSLGVNIFYADRNVVEHGDWVADGNVTKVFDNRNLTEESLGISSSNS